MRRSILGLAAAGLVGFVTAGDASACHKKKAACEPAPAACEPAPVACEAPAKKSCHLKMPKFKMPKLGCHKKKAACEPTMVAYEAPATYHHTAATPQSYAAPQSMAAPQVMPAVPTK